jgi:hypothetical protein
MAQGMAEWHSLVNPAIKYRIQYEVRNFLSCGAVTVDQRSWLVGWLVGFIANILYYLYLKRTVETYQKLK